jgi:hypothetical protein
MLYFYYITYYHTKKFIWILMDSLSKWVSSSHNLTVSALNYFDISKIECDPHLEYNIRKHHLAVMQNVLIVALSVEVVATGGIYIIKKLWFDKKHKEIPTEKLRYYNEKICSCERVIRYCRGDITYNTLQEELFANTLHHEFRELSTENELLSDY